MKKSLYGLLFVLCIAACQSKTRESKLYTLPAVDEDGLQAVIEIPAGTHTKIEYNTETKSFEVDTLNGKSRIINFLPYPGNYGFIPSTYMSPELGGDGDALDVLILNSSLPTGTVLNILPIGAMVLRDNEEIDTKIVAVPLDSTLRQLQITNFRELLIQNYMVKQMIEDWFMSYKGAGSQMELVRWEDEVGALREIEKWRVE
ncbi:MAG: inorganic diphosphatase [Bacteroidota bacterium]